MYYPDFMLKFTPYLDVNTENDGKGNHRDTIDMSLVKDAPQFAVDAFEEYKRLEAEARKEGRIY